MPCAAALLEKKAAALLEKQAAALPEKTAEALHAKPARIRAAVSGSMGLIPFSGAGRSAPPVREELAQAASSA